MTIPRRIIPGKTHLVTRRASQRQFLLRPDAKTNQAVEYCLGEAAQRTGVEIYAFLAMSNHYHAVVHDPNGVLPEFLQQGHNMLSRTMNVRLSRWENFFSPEPCGVTELVTDDDILAKVIYTLANPVAAQLVDRAIIWPGASSIGLLDGRKKVVQRPKWFFSEDGVMPAQVTLEMKVPAGHDAATWAARVRAGIAEAERKAAEERARTGTKVLGRKEVLRTSAFASPSTKEPRRKLSPAIACRDVVRRVMELDALVAFRQRYREAVREFASGVWRAVFPYGTWAMKRFAIRCEEPACPL